MSIDTARPTPPSSPPAALPPPTAIPCPLEPAITGPSGSTVVEVRVPELEILHRAELPAVREAWGERFAGARGLAALVVTLRLSVLGAAAKSVLAGEGSSSPAAEADCFTAVEVLPGAKSLVVGRGDGRVELRDADTLGVTHTFRPSSSHGRVEWLCALSDETVVVSDGDRFTGILSLTTGTCERVDYEDTVTGLRRLPDGRRLVVGPRRVVVYAGGARAIDADFSAALATAIGHECFSRSALSGSTLLLACGQGGLFGVDVGALPLAPPPDEAELRGPELLERLERALVAKAPVAELVAELLGLGGPTLRSKLPTVRNAAACHVTTFAEHFRGRAADVKPLLHDAEPNVRFQAMYALGSLGDPAAIEWLQALRSDPAIVPSELERVLSELAAKR